jgi:L-ribulose-5-phosphate 3-epimerase
MNTSINRREFLSASLAAGLTVGWGAGSAARAQAPAATGSNAKLYKALIMDKPTEEGLKKLKDAGFDGVEAGVLPVAEAEECRRSADKVGMKIHAVLRGWAEFNSTDRETYDRSMAQTEAALRAAQAFGADAVLLVPCRIGGMKTPRPWEFVIEFNPESGHVDRVTVGDNAPYGDYIKAHNHAIDTSREAVRKLIPLAEQCGVVIALENVWNNLWVKPALFRQFVASFQSRWVKAYFDIGNHVKYAPPEEWILVLGDLLAKVHVKDFALNPSDPNGEGKFVNIRDGSVRWPVVRQALARVGYQGWMTIEGGDCSLAEHSKRLDLIIAGE